MQGEIIPHGAPIGRPLTLTDEVAQEICDRLSNGESLRSICRDDTMPGQTTVYRWLDDERNESFRQQYARARQRQGDTLFDEITEIADDSRNDWVERRNEAGQITGYDINGDAIARAKLRIEARRWQAGKLRPKKYGDKLDLTTGGEQINRDSGDVAAKAAALLALARERKDG